MSAQRKLLSVLRPTLRPRQVVPVPTFSLARSITSTQTLLRPAAENVSETGSKQEEKTVPSEQITEEAKKAEPDAAEQAEEMEKKGMDTLPTQT